MKIPLIRPPRSIYVAPVCKPGATAHNVADANVAARIRMDLPEHVYHLAEAANWNSIRRHGLLSAGALLRLTGTADEQIRRQHRRDYLTLAGGLLVRNQRPMLPAALSRCLIGMEPGDWYALLNSKIFFWLDIERLNRQRRACGAGAQVVLTVDTAALIECYGAHIALSPINSGNARRRPAVRGAETFVPYATWLRSGWASEAAGLNTRLRARTHPPVELTVNTAIPDVFRLVLASTVLRPGESFVPHPGAGSNEPLNLEL